MMNTIVSSCPKLRDRSSVVPGFLSSPDFVARQPPRKRRRILASGYATPTYDWMTLLEAFRSMSSEVDLHVVFYNTFDPEYYPIVRNEISRIGDPVVEHQNLSQEEFAALLASVDVFVRPTLTDGDSIAVREALAVGVPVVASDAVIRPAECLVFPTGDSDSLGEQLEAAFDMKYVKSDSQDSFALILKSYCR